jgi:PAS domain S-box-containing protein
MIDVGDDSAPASRYASEAPERVEDALLRGGAWTALLAILPDLVLVVPEAPVDADLGAGSVPVLYGSAAVALGDPAAWMNRVLGTPLAGARLLLRSGLPPGRLRSELLVNGRVRFLETQMVPLAAERFMLVVRDRTMGELQSQALEAAQQTALQADQRLLTALDNFHGVIYQLDHTGQMVLCVGSVSEITGYSASELLSGNIKLRDLLHPDDRANLSEAQRRLPDLLGQPLRLNYRIIRRDGEVRWLSDVQSVVPTANGRPVMQGAAYDVTERKLSEEARALWENQRTQFIGGIIRAQEQERSRVARELHDGIAQSLTGLTVRLAAVSSAATSRQHAAELDAARLVCEEMSADLRRVLHGLHPSVLDDLGLAAALRRSVSEFETRGGITIDLHIGTSTHWEDLPPQFSVTIYRIVQEALQNVVRHAHARSASVVLERRRDWVRLLVEDDGRGMPTTTEYTGGLGLHSVRERAALLGGSARVESLPGAGTAVVVDLPLVASANGRHD